MENKARLGVEGAHSARAARRCAQREESSADFPQSTKIPEQMLVSSAPLENLGMAEATRKLPSVWSTRVQKNGPWRSWRAPKWPAGCRAGCPKVVQQFVREPASGETRPTLVAHGPKLANLLGELGQPWANIDQRVANKCPASANMWPPFGAEVGKARQTYWRNLGKFRQRCRQRRQSFVDFRPNLGYRSNSSTGNFGGSFRATSELTGIAKGMCSRRMGSNCSATLG